MSAIPTTSVSVGVDTGSYLDPLDQLGAEHAATAASAAAASAANAPPLVGSYMLQLYDMRMQYIGDRLDDTMKSMQENNKKQHDLSLIQQALSAIGSGNLDDKDGGKATYDNITNEIAAAKAGLSDNDPLSIQLNNMIHSNAYTDGGDTKLSADEVKSLSDMVSDMQKDIDTNAQRDGMVVNDLMSQKQEIATLFSGIMQTDHASTMASINNIGH